MGMYKKVESIICLLLVLMSVSSFAQSPLKPLIKAKSGDAKAVQDLKEFEASGIEKQFNYGKVTRDEFITQAKKYTGTPYKYGGYSKAGIDCSGLISKAFQDLGLDMTHSVQEMAKYGEIIIDKDELKPGDLIFFTKTYKTKNLISHAGIVIEGGKMLHASSSKGVSATNINNPYYWDKYYLFGTDIFGGKVKVKDQPAVADISGDRLVADVYRIKLKGRFTDSGEKYRRSLLTASHATLAFGTMVEVTNPNNGRKVNVRINDGDSGRDNIGLTLSKKSARKLRIKKGIPVEVSISIMD